MQHAGAELFPSSPRGDFINPSIFSTPKINQAFMFNGDVSHNTAALIPPLLEDGIRVLIYAGEAGTLSFFTSLLWTTPFLTSHHLDFMCNYLSAAPSFQRVLSRAGTNCPPDALASQGQP